MKKQGISVLLILLLLLVIPVSARADVIFPAPGAFVVGEEVNHLLALLDPGASVSIDGGVMPDGLYVYSVEDEDGVHVYLAGVPTTPGHYDLLINYNGTDSICTVTIVPGEEPDPVPVSVSVETVPLVTEYTVGDVLNSEGLSLRVEMSDGSSVLVTEGFELYPTRLNQAGTRSIEVNYGGLLCFFDVEIAPAPEEVLGIGVLKLPSKVVYEIGETLDPSGLFIRVYTNNGTRDEYQELICSPTLLSTPGPQEITVTYGTHSCSFTVQVLEKEAPASIAVYCLPDKLEYYVGEELDSRGLVLIETSNRDNPSYLEGGFVCRPVKLEHPGQQEIVVTVENLQCSFYVTVLQPPAPISEPSSDPGARPQPSAVPAVQPQVSSTPTSVVVTPGRELIPQRSATVGPQSGRILVTVIVAAALAALLVLALYLFVFNQSGKEYLADSVKDLFRRKR